MSILPRVVEKYVEHLRIEAVLAYRILPESPLLTFKEIGDIWGVSRERVRQVEAKVRRRYRNDPIIGRPTANQMRRWTGYRILDVERDAKRRHKV